MRSNERSPVMTKANGWKSKWRNRNGGREVDSERPARIGYGRPDPDRFHRTFGQPRFPQNNERFSTLGHMI